MPRASTQIFLMELTFSGKTWYLSNEGYTGEHYYAPYISQVPKLELGPENGGFVSAKFGNLVLRNVPYDRNSPFSIYSGNYKSLIENTNQLFVARISWGVKEIPLFEGTVYLSSVSTDQISLLLQPPSNSVNLLDEVSDLQSGPSETALSLTSVTGAGSTTATVVTATNHDLNTEDRIDAIGWSGGFDAVNAEIVKVSDTSFTYTTQGSVTGTASNGVIRAYMKQVSPLAFGVISQKSNIVKQANDTGEIYRNPLKHNPTGSDPHLELFDDGILVGTTNSSDVNTTNTCTALTRDGNLATATTGSAHSKTAGTRVQVEGADLREYNGTFTIFDTPTTTSFLYVVFNEPATPAQKGSANVSGSNTLALKFYGNYFGSGRVPTSTLLKSRAADNTGSGTMGTRMIGRASVSGISVHGTNLLEFWQYIQGRLSIGTLNTDKAPTLASKTVTIWENNQSTVKEFAGNIAKSTNCVFWIENDILYVVDRANIPSTFKEYQNYEVIQASFASEYPLQAVEAVWQINIPRPDKFPASLEQVKRQARVENLSDGKILKVQTVHDDSEKMETFLTAIKEYEKQPLINLTVNDVQDDLRIGDRVVFTREEEYSSCDFNIMEIDYDFEKAQTSFKGKGTVSLIERLAVY